MKKSITKTKSAQRFTFTFAVLILLSAASFAQPAVADFSGNPTTICAGQSVSWTNLSQNATNYSWSFPGATQPTSTFQNPNPRQYNTPGVYSVTLIASGGGPMNADTMTKVNYITVLAAPQITISPSPAYFCTGGTPVTLNASGATSYTWQPSGGLSANTGATVQASPSATVTYTIQSNPVNGCIGRTTVQVVVTSNPPPNPGTITGPTSVCSGQSGVVYSVPGVNPPVPQRNWTVPAGAVITAGQGTRQITVTFGTTTGDVCCTASNGCGSSTPSCVTVTVSPTPAVDTIGVITGPSSVCANQSGITYSISPVGNATSYTWTVPGGASITAGQNTNMITVSFSTTPGNVCVRAGNSCNTTPQVCMAVSISQTAPGIPGTISGPATVCNGQTGVVYSVPMPPGPGPAPSYSWTVPAGATITTGQGTRIIDVAFGSISGDICVTASNACGTSLPRCMTLTVSPSPSVGTVGPISGPNTVCANQSGITYSISPVTNATTYTWTVPNGSTITAGQGTTNITVTFSTAPGSVCVTASNSCNSSQPQCMNISVAPNAPGIPGTMTGPATVCKDASGVTYSVPTQPGNPSYSWTVPAGTTITGGQGSRTITVTFGSTSGDICVTASNACGSSLPRCMTVTVSPSAAVDSVGVMTGPSAVCANQSGVVFTIAAVPNATNYTWTIPNGAVITAGQNTTSITVTFSTSPGNVCVTAGNSCNNTQPRCTPVTVSPNAPSIPGNITGPAPVCNGQSGVSYSIAPVTNATSYSWTVPAGSTVTAGQGTRFATVTFGNTTGDVCVSASNACGTSLPKCLTVTVNPTPFVDSVGVITGPIAACANQSGVNYSIAVVTNATSYTWTVPAGATITSGQGTTSIAVTFSLTGGNICVVAGNACNATQPKCIPVSVSLTAPGIPGIITGQTAVCEATAGVTYSVPPVAGATTYSWTVPAGSVITAGQGTTGITVTLGSTSGDVCVTAGNGCGTSLPKCTTLTVTPLPVVTVSPQSPTICPSGSVFLSASGANSYAWSPATGLSASTGATVTASPTSSTMYTVTGTTSGCDNTATANVIVTVCTGIAEQENNSGIRIYPNPSRDNLYVEGAFPASTRVMILLYNAYGQRVGEKEVEVSGTMIEKISVADLPAGMYVVEVRSNDHSSKVRFIKQ